jgi:hypothetical protein
MKDGNKSPVQFNGRVISGLSRSFVVETTFDLFLLRQKSSRIWDGWRMDEYCLQKQVANRGRTIER